MKSAQLWLSMFVVVVLVSPVAAQELPRSEDVSTIEGIMKAYYEVVSGPAGEPKQWARDRSLHHPEAQITIVRSNQDGESDVQVMTLAEFHGDGDGTSEVGFFEYEVHRVVHRHGKNAHVWSTYEWRRELDGPIGGRGVNSIQLYHDGSRWWIMGWMFDGRPDVPPVDDAFLPEESWAH